MHLAMPNRSHPRRSICLSLPAILLPCLALCWRCYVHPSPGRRLPIYRSDLTRPGARTLTHSARPFSSSPPPLHHHVCPSRPLIFVFPASCHPPAAALPP
ncbi:hypothetical protein CC78DRAFT_51048 [Lojkania enalia]|uniref:Secreted protein n=1 Tax=Lojkania enalia TaxID=147567 RepID=A0A9P4MW57_9PLEO|nr:hypothetical protein CC78DRAFT_51048 [Didymosphaeria enalia]